MDIKRFFIYIIFCILVKKGLISPLLSYLFLINNLKYFTASDPKVLLASENLNRKNAQNIIIQCVQTESGCEITTSIDANDDGGFINNEDVHNNYTENNHKHYVINESSSKNITSIVVDGCGGGGFINDEPHK